MSKEINDEGRTRYQQRSKRKKTNFILNGLIIVVILLIVFVSYSIFHTNDEKNADKNKDSDTKTGQQASGDKETASSTTGSDNTDENTTTEEEEEEESEDGEVVTEGGSDSNVIKTIENSSWQPVGTTQTGEHVASYSEGVDWNEQIKALSYATGLDSGNMTLWFLGNNNQDPHKSIGTVSSKDKSAKYRVYIEWVDGSGWKPTKVEEIKDLNIR
ncbi:YrrS family protein [Cytobacillus oceanisediminis]|uniref:YrrS family protein n=1 Tax=Cytobacillus oceanisediminis TaxID=665099 RepID=UPI001CCB73E7|nr:YrrS family protein [Cytobacillus oceanisediminis]MBQ6447957.1 YrrS family protein [Bacillus sp. (in: firmicutes)]MBZ9535380.1 YrrS family protein [Cytobacillus oceanisediminis]